jgi:hypothetical protein
MHSGRNNLGGEQTRRLERNGMSAALENDFRGKVVSRIEAGSRSSVAQGKADDTDEETGTSSLWDRRGMGPGIRGKIRRITSGRSRRQQGLMATCTDSLNEAKAEGGESRRGSAHESVRAMNEG